MKVILVLTNRQARHLIGSQTHLVQVLITNDWSQLRFFWKIRRCLQLKAISMGIANILAAKPIRPSCLCENQKLLQEWVNGPKTEFTMSALSLGHPDVVIIARPSSLEPTVNL